MTADIETDTKTDMKADITATVRMVVVMSAAMSAVMSVVMSAGMSVLMSAFTSAVMPLAAQSLPGDTTITIRASSSSLEFEPASIVVKQGRRLKLRFVNAGTLPHNFVLVKNEDDIDALAMAAMQEAGDYVPKDMRNRLLAFTTLASPGQTVEVAFVAPPAGVYTYVCLMSGHAAMMLGTLHSLR